MNRDHRKWHVDFLALALILIIFYFWFAWPLVWTASQNMRLIDAFDVDEALHVYIVKGALNQHTFRLMFNNYGHLYFNLALLPLFLIDHVSAMTEQKIIVVLRLISTIAAMATVASVFMLAKRFFGRLSAWISSLFFLAVPLLFTEYSINSHPDILLKKETLVREETSPSVKAGKWIEKSYPASSRVLYDRFCYVPVSFANAYGTWDVTLDLLKTFNPDIVIVNKMVSYPYK